MFVDGIVRQRLMAATMWGLLASGAAYLFVFTPGSAGFFPLCPFRALTGFTCPGCGATRALHQLLHGNLIAAFELNPLLMLAIPVLGWLLVLFTKCAIEGRPMPHLTLKREYAWAIYLLVFGFWVLRNTRAYPFPV